MRMHPGIGYERPSVHYEDVAQKIGLTKTSGGRGTAIFELIVFSPESQMIRFGFGREVTVVIIVIANSWSTP